MKKLPFGKVKKKKKTKRKKLKPISKLIKKAWDLRSKYIRQKGANEHGIVKCYTCDAPHMWKDIQGGHFVHGMVHPSYMMDDNSRPQDVACNKWRNGMGAEFEKRLRVEIGDEKVDNLLAMRYQIWKPSRQALEDIIKTYKDKIEDLAIKNLD